MTSQNPSRTARALDPVDHHILELLAADGRMSNKDLAAEVGIAPSTCLVRVRRLVDLGVLRGVHAQIDPEVTGRSLQAVVAVRIRSDARDSLGDFSRRMAGSPMVAEVRFVSGAYNFMVLVAGSSSEDLRTFVADVNALPTVAGTETHLVFERLHGRASV